MLHPTRHSHPNTVPAQALYFSLQNWGDFLPVYTRQHPQQCLLYSREQRAEQRTARSLQRVPQTLGSPFPSLQAWPMGAQLIGGTCTWMKFLDKGTACRHAIGNQIQHSAHHHYTLISCLFFKHCCTFIPGQFLWLIVGNHTD